MAATSVDKVQISTSALKTPRVVLGKNDQNEEVYLYFDSDLKRVVISGAMGLAYEDRTNNKIYVFDVTSPSNP